jgi:hypothetical protein
MPGFPGARTGYQAECPGRGDEIWWPSHKAGARDEMQNKYNPWIPNPFCVVPPRNSARRILPLPRLLEPPSAAAGSRRSGGWPREDQRGACHLLAGHAQEQREVASWPCHKGTGASCCAFISIRSMLLMPDAQMEANLGPLAPQSS